MLQLFSVAGFLQVMQSGTDDEKLRAEKEYYHLLYTSYDEEELLRELKSGAAPAPEAAATATGGTDPAWTTARTSLGQHRIKLSH